MRADPALAGDHSDRALGDEPIRGNFGDAMQDLQQQVGAGFWHGIAKDGGGIAEINAFPFPNGVAVILISLVRRMGCFKGISSFAGRSGGLTIHYRSRIAN